MKKIYFILLLFLSFLPGHLLAACDVSSIALNESKAGSWSAGCTSDNLAGRYAQYYTFTLASTQEVTIDLESSVDTYLNLLSGAGQSTDIIASNDDISGSNRNSRITRTLNPGTYTIEATTWAIAQTGNFTVSIAVEGSTSIACDNFLDANVNVAGSWDAGCTSTHRDGRYARYYTFTLAIAQEVTVNLQSSRDTYMYLLMGTGQTGSVIEEDNNGGSGTNSRITRTLNPGSYTIEATTNTGLQIGDFTVSVTIDSAPPPGACEYLINTGESEEGSWNSDCPSNHREGSYASYYTFTLSSTNEVAIELESSSSDPYMFLLQDSGPDGNVLAQNDDGGVGDNSRIVMTLSAGTYTVEATTYNSAATGSFVLSVSIVEPGCDDCPFQINAGLNDAWFNSATSGQGFNITVYPVRKEMFVTWFTYDVERPPGDVTAMLGGPGQRWLTAQGTYDDDTATLTIYVTEGGVFDSASPPASTDQDGDGTMIVEFSDCEEGLVTYDITSLDLSDEIPIERVVLDNVPLCEMLAEP